MFNLRRVLILIGLIAALGVGLLTAGCVPNNSDKDIIQNYINLKPNAYYEYVSSPDTKASQRVFISYIDGNRLQRRVSSDTMITTEVLEVKNGEFRLVYTDPVFYFYENITSAKSNSDFLILKEPLKAGQSWGLDKNSKCEITRMDADVTTPYGTFKAMEVVSERKGNNNSNISVKDYYAKGIGLVKSIYAIPDAEEITIDLVSIREGTGLDTQLDCFFPNLAKNDVVDEPKVLTLTTNNNLAKIIEEKLKSPTDVSLTPLLANNVKINSITVNRPSDSLIIDMTKSFEENLKQSGNPTLEELTLRGLADTLATFYDVTNVFMTLDGKAYKSAKVSWAE